MTKSAECAKCGTEFTPPEEGDIVKVHRREEVRVSDTPWLDPGMPRHRSHVETRHVTDYEPRCDDCL